ncbi:MAG: hypothetical protein AAGC55_06730, partial [Myxococcota bacterium]
MFGRIQIARIALAMTVVVAVGCRVRHLDDSGDAGAQSESAPTAVAEGGDSSPAIAPAAGDAGALAAAPGWGVIALGGIDAPPALAPEVAAAVRVAVTTLGVGGDPVDAATE